MRSCSLDGIPIARAIFLHFLTDLTTSRMIFTARFRLTRKYSATSDASSRLWLLSESEMMSALTHYGLIARPDSS
jgi:hypothetical protein